jgi:RND family efflux transporter MFP subunit
MLIADFGTLISLRTHSADGARLRHLPLVLLLLVVLSAGWWFFGRGVEITAVAATRGIAAEIVYATGSVEPIHWAKVASVIRERIVYVCDCEGQMVAKGDVLARLDDKEPRAQLLELKAREDLAQREYTRQAELMARGVASSQVQERASADLRTIQGQISVQMEKLASYVITAPMDGMVLRRDGEIGEIAEAGQILVRIGAPRPLRVVAEVNEEDIPRVALGQTVLLRTDAFVDRRLEGRISELTPMGDSLAKTFRIYVALPEDTPLQPGMSVEANIVTREKPDSLLVPADAVQGSTVFVVEGNRLKRRDVNIGIRGTRAVEIRSGLADGERVVSPYSSDLADGSRVRVIDKGASP